MALRGGRQAASNVRASKARQVPLRAALAAAFAASLLLAGCVDLPFQNHPEAAARGDYIRDVGVAVETLSLVFAQADESVRAFQAGWLAPEGAASEFQFLHGQVKGVKADITAASPPADMEVFHRQLGRSVSLTQQAMDAMQAGFSSGDATYFELAHEKLAEARTVLDSAIDGL
jgi:hypothetical protein